MFNRFCFGALLLAGLVLPLTSCVSSPSLTSITVSPTTMNFGGAGLTTQLTATGYYTHPNHPAETKNITDEVTWASSTPECVTVSSTGFITSGGNTCTNILVTASAHGFNGLISGSMTVNVTQSSGGGSTTADVTGITIIPSAQSVASPGKTGQFIAIGTTSSGATVNLTNAVAWTSSSVQIATITSTGLATGLGQGVTTITALYTNADGTTATGQANFTVTSGTSEPLTALSITPTAESLSASGQTGQLIALGVSGTTGLQENVTNSPQVTWSSSIPTIASVSAGLVTGMSVGSTTITAIWTNPDGTVVSASPATITVTSTAAPEPLLSLTIIPSSITVLNLQGTGNFLAIGTFSNSPQVRDLTDSVTWISTEPNIFPVNTNTGGNTGASAGIVTAYGSGGAVILAEATDSVTGSIQTATATFNCPLVPPDLPVTYGSCFPGSEASSLLSTITVYNEGLNTTNWLVTAPSATGTADVIHCGPGWTGTGGSVCVATYPIGTPVILTAPAGTGAFGGWSSNCTPSPNPPTAAGPNTCTIIPTTSNETVGAIFN